MSEEPLYRQRSRTARIAGGLYALLAMAMFPHMLRGRLFVFDDAAATARNILGNELIFRVSILADLVFQIAFLLLALALYHLLAEVSRNVARVMIGLVVVAVPIALLNSLNQIAALLLFQEGEEAQAMLFLRLFGNGVFIAQVFWGLWMFPFGVLVHRSGFLPKALGPLLMAGCFGYLVDAVAGLVAPSLRPSIEPVVMISAVAEILTLLWLLVFGVRRPTPTPERA